MEFVEAMLEGIPAVRDRLRRSPERGRVGCRRCGGRRTRIAHERLGERCVGNAVGGEERGELTRRQAMAIAGVGEAALHAGRKGAEGQGGRERKPPVFDARHQVGGEAANEIEAAHGPDGLVAEKLGGGADAQAVLAHQ